MAGPVARSASRLISYSATGPACHCRRALSLAAALALGLSGGGCALSGMFSSDDNSAVAAVEITGSIPARAAGNSRAAVAAAPPLPPEIDLAYAKAAAVEVLARGSKDTSVPWENPRTGARGTVTPIAVAYNRDGMTCRDFLASHVGRGDPAWMQGEACRNGTGRWEVRALRPWTRS